MNIESLNINSKSIDHSLSNPSKEKETEIKASFDAVPSKEISPFELFKKEATRNSVSDTLDKPKERTLFERAEEARTNSKKWPPVVFAIEMKDYELLKFLIDMGEDLEKRLPDIPVVHEQIRPGRPPIVTHGYDPGPKTLEYALKKDDLQAVEILLEYCPNNKASVSGKIFEIELKCQKEIVALLLKHASGLNINSVIEKFRQNGHLEHLAAALEYNFLNWKGEKISISQEVLQDIASTSFLDALKNNNETLIERYIELGLEILPLHTSLVVSDELFNKMLSGNISPMNVLNALVERGVDFERVKEAVKLLKPASKAFEVASRWNNVSLTEYLLSLGATPTFAHFESALKNKSDDVALLIIPSDKAVDKWFLQSVKEGRIKVVEELLSKKTFTKETLQQAEKLAYELKHYHILDMLLKIK